MAEILSDEAYFGGGKEPKIAIVPAEHHGKMHPHAHEFYEVVYVSDGFTLHTCGGAVQMLVTGDLFFIRPGEVHAYVNAYQAKLYNFLFKEEELAGSLEELSLLPGLDLMFGKTAEASFDKRVIHTALSERRGMEAELERLRKEGEERQSGWQVVMRAALMHFLVRYARMYQRQAAGAESMHGQYYPYVYRILQYIGQHYAEEITMGDLAGVAGISPDYLTRKFREVLGMTPLDYLRTFRLSRAMELLSGTDLTVAEIVPLAGFSTASVFTRTFRSLVGVPPSNYRRRIMPGTPVGNVGTAAAE